MVGRKGRTTAGCVGYQPWPKFFDTPAFRARVKALGLEGVAVKEGNASEYLLQEGIDVNFVKKFNKYPYPKTKTDLERRRKNATRNAAYILIPVTGTSIPLLYDVEKTRELMDKLDKGKVKE